MKASECINIIEDRRFSTLVYQDGAVQTILAALRLLAATEGEEGTPETDALESAAPIDYEDARFMRRLERERNAARKALAECREDAGKHRVGAWGAAIVLAHNICIQEIDRINENDGPCEAMDAIKVCAERIKDWLAPTDEQSAEMIAEAAPAIDAARRTK